MRNIARTASAALLCVLAAGCAQMAAERQAAQDSRDDARCRQYGAAPGSQAYFECRMLVASQRETTEAALDMQRRQNMFSLGAAMLAR